MSSRFLYLFMFFHFAYSSLLAQPNSTFTISFNPVFDHSTIRFDDTYYKLNNTDSIQFQELKFYISGIELLKDEQAIWKEENSFHLIDASDTRTIKVLLKTPPDILFNKIRFNLGIDSTTNVSGAMGGDLDPTKGMYWTWQNGYINLKLEGKSNLCKTRNNEFQFHLGGYQYPFNALQKICLGTNTGEDIFVTMDLAKLIKTIDLVNENHIMSPGDDAIRLSQKTSEIIRVQVK